MLEEFEVLSQLLDKKNSWNRLQNKFWKLASIDINLARDISSYIMINSDLNEFSKSEMIILMIMLRNNGRIDSISQLFDSGINSRNSVFHSCKKLEDKFIVRVIDTGKLKKVAFDPQFIQLVNNSYGR